MAALQGAADPSANRSAATPETAPPDTTVPVVIEADVAVIGGGTMGTGIAMAYANSGVRVLLKEVDDAALARAMATITKTWDSAVAKGRFDAYERDRRLSLITPTTTQMPHG